MEKSYKMQQTLFEILPPLQVITKIPLFTRPLMLCMSVGQEIAIDVCANGKFSGQIIEL